MGLPRKRKYPRWTSEMFEIPAAREPKDPPEKRDCGKPKAKTLPTPRSSSTTTEDPPSPHTTERIAFPISCVFGESPTLDNPVESPDEEPPLKRLKIVTAGMDEKTDETVDGLGFQDVWGSKKQMASPNSRRNKDMLWSLHW